MPQVAAMIERDYHVKPVLADPDEAVAKGAAVYASNEKAYNDFIANEAAKTGKTVEEIKEENLVTGALDQKYAQIGGAGAGEMRISITNVLSRTYGVAALDEKQVLKVFNMLMINEKLPATNTETFYTSCDNQSALSLKIFESRSTDSIMDIDGREPITVIEMKFNRAVPMHTPVVQTLALDNSGILHIVAEEQMYHTKLDTTFQLSNQMTDEEMRSATMRMSSANVE